MATSQDVPPPTSSSFTRLVMGSAPGEMGLADAGGRAGELRRSLDELATVLAHRPDALTWPVVLDKLAVAASQAAGLRARVRPLARAYAAHPAPGGIDGPASAAALPVLLSSRRLPEMETAAGEAVAAAAEAAGLPAAGAPGELYAALAGRADALNAVVDGLIGGGGGGGGGRGGGAPQVAQPPPHPHLPPAVRGALDPRGDTRRKWAAQLHTAAAAAATAAAAAGGAGSVLGGGVIITGGPAGAAAVAATAPRPAGPPTPAASLVTAVLEGRLPA